jgi:hypothetical protein
MIVTPLFKMARQCRGKSFLPGQVWPPTGRRRPVRECRVKGHGFREKFAFQRSWKPSGGNVAAMYF